MIAKKQILVVDDSPEIIDALVEILKNEYVVKVSTNGPKALDIVFSRTPPDLILLDIKMPGMDGYQVCQQLKDQLPHKMIPVIFITGSKDEMDEVRALEMGGVDYIQKPIQSVIIRARVETHLRLQETSSRLESLLSQTLLGSIQLMAQTLSMTNPLAFNQACRIKKLVRRMAEYMQLENIWRFETAALLSNIGCVALPIHLLKKVFKEEIISKSEQALFQSHPAVGADLIRGIPGLDEVAGMVLHQLDPFNPQLHEGPPDLLDPVQLGGQILKVAIAFDMKVFKGERPSEVISVLAGEPHIYSPELIQTLARIEKEMPSEKEKSVAVKDLHAGMILLQDLVDEEDFRIASAGHAMTQESVQMIRSYHKNKNLKEPLRVKVAGREMFQ
ncbi:response regulator [Nitrospina sp. 32_T5]|uniref:response regulator n=1 Tax=unclassified Nitrospina TaxID=2638683 RepID=UPI003F99AD4D